MTCNIPNRTIYHSDNLPILRGINTGSIDLIYLDPPFAKNDTFVGTNKKIAEIKAWYLDLQQRRKLFLDENFNEVFKDTPVFSDVFSHTDIHRTWYSHIDTYNHELIAYFDSIRKSAKAGIFYYLIYMTIRLIELHRILKDTGSLYLHCDPTASHYLKIILDKIFGAANFRNEIVWCYKFGGSGKQDFAPKHDIIFRYCKSSTFVFNDHLVREFETTSNWGQRKDGKILTDWQYIPTINTMSKERTGYPTQKPLALLERIIKASSNEGDVVLDPFCGCATTCIAAETLNRKWVGIDLSTQAYYMIYWRAHYVGIGTEAQRDIFDRNLLLKTDPPTRTDTQETVPFYHVTNRTELKTKVATTISPQYRKEAIDFLYQEQAGICNGCDQYMRKVDLTLDHIVPLSQGPNHDIDNLQLLCYRCNNWKRDHDMVHLIQTLYNRHVISVGTAKKQMKRYLGTLTLVNDGAE